MEAKRAVHGSSHADAITEFRCRTGWPPVIGKFIEPIMKKGGRGG